MKLISLLLGLLLVAACSVSPTDAVTKRAAQELAVSNNASDPNMKLDKVKVYVSEIFKSDIHAKYFKSIVLIRYKCTADQSFQSTDNKEIVAGDTYYQYDYLKFGFREGANGVIERTYVGSIRRMAYSKRVAEEPWKEFESNSAYWHL